MNKCELQQPARRRLRVADLNPHLMCILCGGYYVDATTIIECLHSFCKSCLVRYLESNKYCPICEVQVHKTRPLQNIRPDETLQNMVYKLVPGLFQREMQIREEFYSKHPDAPESSPVDRGIIDPVECQFYSPEEAVSLALEFKSQASTSSSSNGVYKRYLRCPAAVTIAHLQKLVRNKFGLASHYDVEIMFLDKHLQPDLSIMDVAYAFQRKRKEQFHFTYRIVDTKCKKMRLDAPALLMEVNSSEPMEVDPAPQSVTPQVSTASQSPTESKSKLDSIISRLGIAKQTEEASRKEKVPEEWKEVQLQISENGVMSVTDISSLDKLIDSVEKNISSVESSANRKPLDSITKAEPEEKKAMGSVKPGKSKACMAESVAPAKNKFNNASSGGEVVNKPVTQSNEKISKGNKKTEERKNLETVSVVSSSSTPITSSKSTVVNSSSNSSSVKEVTASVASCSSTVVVSSVSNSSSLSAVKASYPATNTSTTTTSVAASDSPVSSVSSGNFTSRSISSTKVTTSDISSVSASSSAVSVCAPPASSHTWSSPVVSKSTVSVTSVVTPAVSATSASSPALKAVTASTSSGSCPASTTASISTSAGNVTSHSTSSASVVSTTVPLSSYPSSVVGSSTSTIMSSPASRTSSIALSTSTTTTASLASSVSTPKQLSNTPAPVVSSKKSSSSPVGYKTLKCGPKTWNPTISRNSFLSSKLEQQQQQNEAAASGSGSSGSAAPGKQAAPPRFFKMRNTPRYLGNPASGVKPMYQVPESQAATTTQAATTQAATTQAAPAPSKGPSLMKLDPRTLTPIVSNASSPTVKSPTSQAKGRPPFPSTTLSAQVNNHLASSRSVTTATTTTSSANLASMRSSASSAQAQAMANFLNPFVPKGLPNFLYGAIPSLLPSGAAQFANMLRPYPPVHPAMLFPHQMHRQLSVPPSPAPSPSARSPTGSPPAVQRIPPSGDKALYRSNPVKMNGQDSPKSSVAVKPKTSPRPATEPPYSPTPSKTGSNLLHKESGRIPGGGANDNNNTVPASKVKAHFEKSDGEKLSHNISKLLPKAMTKHSDNQISLEPKGAGVSSFQTPH